MDAPLHALFDLLIVGHGTTYRVNSILVQPGSFGETTSMECFSVPTKCGRRSFQSPTGGMIQGYHNGCRVGGPEKLWLLHCPQLYLSWMCQKFYKDQSIPSWTGYNLCIRSSEVILESSIIYLECINAPATDISTINDMLEQALKMKTSTNLKSIVRVFDQSIFAKVTEIKCKKPTGLFDNACHISYNNVYGSDLQTVKDAR